MITHYNNTYMYEEFSRDKFINKDIDNNLINENNKRHSSSFKASDFLPPLKRPENDITLNKLIEYYNDCVKATRISPIFIRNGLKNRNQNLIKEAEDCFSLLINSYKSFKSDKNIVYKDESFLSSYVNQFINSFEKMVSKLIKAGFNTYKLGLDSI